MDSELERLRAQAADVDSKLLELVAKRARLASAIGKTKRAEGVATRDFRQERAGSSRFLNMEAVGHGLRLLSRLYQGSIGRSLWHRLDEEPGGEDELTVMDRRLEEQCAMCRFRGLGDRAAGRAAEVIRGRAPRRELSDRQAARLMRLETFLDL